MWMKIRKEEVMTYNNISGNGQQQQPGMKCPQCDTFIETSIFQLLTKAGDRPVQVAPRIRRPAKGSGRTGQP